MARKPSGTWAPLGPPRNKAFEDACRGKDLSDPVAYNPKSNYQLGDVIKHMNFGIGIVMGHREGNKIIVVFNDKTRKLAGTLQKDR